jgi:methionyl-tRNA synthetase
VERVFIGVAWPYANGPLHLGHIAGAYLPADVFARYHRLKGNEVLMVSGSDMHGTPITVRAEREGKTPAEVACAYHQEFRDSFKKLGISFNLYTSTETPNHYEVVRDIFLHLYHKGHIYQNTIPLPYCPTCHRFLPDRYVEGICPHCQFDSAHGDQCEKCGRTLSPWELKEPHCILCQTTPEERLSEHFFLRLSSFQDKLLKWVEKQGHWRPGTRNFTLSMIQGGLQDRAITRDIQWGIPIPLPGFEEKRIYVWFEAVIGYLSAAKEWATLSDRRWEDFWQGEVKSYYFVGKDNISFHTIIWPAILMGYGDLNLPYDVPANEFLTLEGRQLSTSRNWAVWVPDFLTKYDPDQLRYALTVDMPQTSDSNFSWDRFLHLNNDELVGTYGNLAHRVLSLIHRKLSGVVPPPEGMDEESIRLIDKAKDTLKAVDGDLCHCRFREGIREAMLLAGEANRYLERKSPWKNEDRLITSMYTSLFVLSALRTTLYPFLPSSSERLHHLLGEKGRPERWEIIPPPVGMRLPPPQALFEKLAEGIVEEEKGRLNSAATIHL